MGLGRIAAGVYTGGMSEKLRFANKLLGGGEKQSAESQHAAVDPVLVEQRNRMGDYASQFANNLGDYKGEQIRQAGEGSRRDLSARLADVTTAANQRGLLYSGLKQGAEQDERASAASDLAGTTSDINRTAEEQSRQMTQQDIQAGMGLRNALNQRAQNVYNLSQEQEAQRGGLLKGLGGSVGTIAGMGQYGSPKKGSS